MNLSIWPILYLEIWWTPSATHHHEPQPWKARPDFKRFDSDCVRTAAAVKIGEPKPRMPWRCWIYWKDRDGKIWARHWDWLWFPPRRWFDKHY